MRCRQTIVGWLSSITLICIVGISLSIASPVFAAPSRQFSQVTDIVEVSPPETIQKLRSQIDRYQPQVKILSPAADQLLKDDSVSVRFDVKNLPIYKDAQLGLGPHLNVLLDNQPAQEIYDLSQPLIFKDLAPGTHTIRAVAARPWAESFKNSSAFAQTTFHVFTKTDENHPSIDQPLLTYGQPQGVVGTDTVLIDFFLSNLPEQKSNLENWQAQISVNGTQFRINEWQPFYVQGLKPGKNWVQMLLTDRQGRKIENTFNDTIRIVELRENGNDTLSKLVRGELSVLDAGGIVNPNYKRPQPPVKPAPSPSPSESVPPKAEAPKAVPVPAPVIKQPEATPESQAPPAKSVNPAEPVKPKSLETQKQPAASVKPTPSAQTKQKPTVDLQKPTVDLTKEKDISPAPLPASQPIKTEPSVKARGKESNKAAPAKPPAAKAETKSPASLQTDQATVKAIPPADLKETQPTDKTSGIEKTAPKPVEKSAPVKVDTSPKAAPKTVAPKSEPPKVSPTPTQPSVKTPVPSPPTPKSSSPEPIKEKSPARPNQPEQSKPTQKDEDSSLKTTFSKFWKQVRPESTQPSPSKAGEKAPANLESKPVTSPTPQKVEPKPVPSPAPQKVEPKPTPNLSAPSKTQVAPSPKKMQSAPSSRSTSQGGSPSAKAKTPTLAPSQPTPKPSTTTPPKSPTSQPSITQPPKASAVTPKASESSAKPTSGKSKKPQPATPAAGKSNASVFSSFRDRLQQFQKSSTPEQKSSPVPKAATPSTVKPTVATDKSTAPAQTVPPKTNDSATPATPSQIDNLTKKETAKPSGTSKETSQPSALSVLRDRWQQQKQLMAPAKTVNPAPVKPDVKKTPSMTEAKTTHPGPTQSTPAKPSSTSAAQKTTPKSPVQKPPVTQPKAKEPAAKSVEPKPSAAQSAKPKSTDSVFSSLRNQWQQQKQLMTPTEKAKPTPVKPAPQKNTGMTGAVTSPPSSSQSSKSPTTSATQKKPVAERSTSPSIQKPPVTQPKAKEPVAKPSAPKPPTTQSTKPKSTDSVFSSLRNQWQLQKQLMAPTEKAKPTPVKPTPQKTAGTMTPSQEKGTAAQKSAPPTLQKQLSAQRSTPKPSATPATVKAPAAAKPAESKSSATTQPTPAQPTESIFSSLRDRWQQQLNPSGQKTTPSSTPKTVQPSSSANKGPEPAKTLIPAPSTPTKSESMKTVSKPFSSSSLRAQDKQKKLQSPPPTVQTPRQKQLSAQTADSPKVAPSQPKASPKTTHPPVSSSKSKVSSPSTTTSQSVNKTEDAPSTNKAQQSESTVFDPGVYYRRFFSGKTANTPPG